MMLHLEGKIRQHRRKISHLGIRTREQYVTPVSYVRNARHLPMLIRHQVGDNARNNDKSGNFRCDCPVAFYLYGHNILINMK